MKLLREFLRLQTAGRFLMGRRDTSRQSWTITVPEPLAKPPRPAQLASSH